MPAGVGNMGGIGAVSGDNRLNNSSYGIRNIQSSKGMNRPATNNLMMS